MTIRPESLLGLSLAESRTFTQRGGLMVEKTSEVAIANTTGGEQATNMPEDVAAAKTGVTEGTTTVQTQIDQQVQPVSDLPLADRSSWQKEEPKARFNSEDFKRLVEAIPTLSKAELTQEAAALEKMSKDYMIAAGALDPDLVEKQRKLQDAYDTLLNKLDSDFLKKIGIIVRVGKRIQSL